MSSQAHPCLQEVGRQFNALRKELGFTHADLGDNIGLETSNVHQLEPG
jgi:hypothetical protein